MTSRSPTPELTFVVGNSLEQLRDSASRTVRSHVARVSWSNQQKGDPKSRRRRRPPHELTIYEGAQRSDSSQEAGPSTTSPVQLARPLINTQLDAARQVDPFSTYPAHWQRFFPRLVDHYIQHLAADICELDSPTQQELLRQQWWPLVTTEPAALLTVLLSSASNYCRMHGKTGLEPELLRLKGDALRAINEAFHDQEKRLSDGLILAAAEMASFEAIHGSQESFLTHMNGLSQMVSLRHGLAALGLHGLLRRIIIWIDLNSSNLLQTARFFPGEVLSAEPSPTSEQPSDRQ